MVFLMKMKMMIPVFGILTRTREFPFLVSALSIFLIANISMNSRFQAPDDRLKKASKKSLTQFIIL